MGEKRKYLMVGLQSLTRFNMAAVGALLVYLQADTASAGFLAMTCLLLLPAAGTVLLERRIESMGLLVISELSFLLLLLVPELTGGTDHERNCLLFGLLILIVFSMLSAGSGKRNLLDRPVAAEGFLFVVAYILALLSDAGHGYQFFLYFLSVSFLLLYFYWRNHYTLQAFIRTNGGGGADREQQVEQVSRQSMMPFLAGMLVLSLLVWIPMGSQVLADKLSENYSEAVDGVTEWFADMEMTFEDTEGGTGQKEEQGDRILPVAREEVAAKQEDASESVDVLGVIIEMILYAMVGLMIWLLFLILRRLSQEATNRNRNEVQQEYEMTITEESNRLERKKVRRQKVRPEEAENQKIRRIYRDEVQQGLSQTKKQVIYEALTPTELEVQAGLAGEKQIAQLHRLYEKARYGKEPCTKEERMLAEQSTR